MCGRYTITQDAAAIAARFAVQQLLIEPTQPRFNVAPTQQIPVIYSADGGVRTLDAYRWGLVPHWAKDVSIGNKMINARAETVGEKPSFKNALKRRRCLIPADGFYEWQQEKKDGKVIKQPMHIHLAGKGIEGTGHDGTGHDGTGANSRPLFAFAGLWEEWKQPDSEPLRTCTIITTTPNKLMEPIHNRMPVILRPEAESIWLDTSNQDVPDLLQLLAPYPAEEMGAYPVSKLVNGPRFDGPQCVEHMVEEWGEE